LTKPEDSPHEAVSEPVEPSTVKLLVDAGTHTADHARFLTALLSLCDHPALGTQPEEKIAALEYVLAIERMRAA
jgi:hypothetical protein